MLSVIDLWGVEKDKIGKYFFKYPGGILHPFWCHYEFINYYIIPPTFRNNNVVNIFLSWANALWSSVITYFNNKYKWNLPVQNNVMPFEMLFWIYYNQIRKGLKTFLDLGMSKL